MDDKFAKDALKKVGDYLINLRINDRERLREWLEFNLIQGNDGLVFREDGTKVNQDILRVIAAYINCLDVWGYGYGWEYIDDSRAEPGILISNNRGSKTSIAQSEVMYVQGKPYRFSIATKRATWYFEDHKRHFDISPRNGTPTTF